MILEQLTRRKITEDEIANFDETVGELVHSSMYALATASELSDFFLTIQSARHQVLERQKLEKRIERSTSVDRTEIEVICAECTLF